MTDAWERTLICHPEDEPKLRAGLEQMPEAHGRVRILARTLVPRGQAYLVDDARIEDLVHG